MTLLVMRRAPHMSHPMAATYATAPRVTPGGGRNPVPNSDGAKHGVAHPLPGCDASRRHTAWRRHGVPTMRQLSSHGGTRASIRPIG